jgi:hypothetical protein
MCNSRDVHQSINGRNILHKVNIPWR